MTSAKVTGVGHPPTGSRMDGRVEEWVKSSATQFHPPCACRFPYGVQESRRGAGLLRGCEADEGPAVLP